MARKKELFLIIDTETANSIEQPLCYDIGYAICDRQGKIYLERSFVVSELFLDHKDLMQSAYFADKIPQYWEDIKNGTRVLKSIFNIRKQIHEDMKKYSIRKVGAYNMGFDKRALNNTSRYCSQSRFRWFFPWGTTYICIWNMACQLLLARPSYIKFAIKNNFISEKGNILTNAECCYRYLTKNTNFKEEHQGLDDVNIEAEILLACFKQHKKVNQNPYQACWRMVQNKRAEMGV